MNDQGRDTLVIDPGIGVAVVLATDLGSGGGIVDPMKGEGGAGHGNGGGVTQGRDIDHAIEGSGQEIVLGREAGGIGHGPERGEIGQDPERREIGLEAGEGSPDQTSSCYTMFSTVLPPLT